MPEKPMNPLPFVVVILLLAGGVAYLFVNMMRESPLDVVRSYYECKDYDKQMMYLTPESAKAFDRFWRMEAQRNLMSFEDYKRNVYNRDAAVCALGQIGSPKALAALEPLTRAADPERAKQALKAMCQILGMPESRDTVLTMKYRPSSPTAGAHMKYAALCYLRSDAYELKYIRLAVRELGAALSLEPKGPRAQVARRVRAAIERLHGI